MTEHVIVRLSSQGHNFEILVDAEKIQKYRKGLLRDIDDVVTTRCVFKDIRYAKKVDNKQPMQDRDKSAERIEDDILRKVFGTTDFLEVARQIIDKGEIQYTAKQRRMLMQQRNKQIVNIIARGAIDPRTKTPHTAHRIEMAMKEARVKIDINKSAEAQVKGVIRAIAAILPLRLETRKILFRIPITYSGKCRNILDNMSNILKEEWSPTHFNVVVGIGAGVEDALYRKLNAIAHGEIVSEVIE